MTTLTKFIVGLIVSYLLMSCQFNSNYGFGVNGNGNVQTQERHVNENFDEIKVSRGLDVYLTQSDFLVPRNVFDPAFRHSFPGRMSVAQPWPIDIIGW